MLTYDASAGIIKEFPWLKEYERDLEACIKSNARQLRLEAQGSALRDDDEFSDAVRQSYDELLYYLKNAREFNVDDSLEDIASFVASSRPMQVWAILISKARRQVDEWHTRGREWLPAADCKKCSQLVVTYRAEDGCRRIWGHLLPSMEVMCEGSGSKPDDVDREDGTAI